MQEVASAPDICRCNGSGSLPDSLAAIVPCCTVHGPCRRSAKVRYDELSNVGLHTDLETRVRTVLASTSPSFSSATVVTDAGIALHRCTRGGHSPM